jgi:ribosomal protein S18 acetylase RimI-like enzyme
MKIIPVAFEHLELVVSLYKGAAKKMEAENIFQWDDMYPDENILQADIAAGQMFAGVLPEIVSLFVLNQECDAEYADAAWEDGNDFMVLHRFCVHADKQGAGIGKQTMRAIEKMLKSKGVRSLRLDTFSQNPRALNLYRSLGYKKTGEAQWRKGLFFLFEKLL